MALRGLFLLFLVPYGLWLVFAYDYHFVDGANLLFHEAGHVFFGLLGETIGILGGTLGQFVFPTAAGIQLLMKGRRFDAAVCAVWFGENLMYTARYMGDAQAMVLPMVGGEIHDWNWLLSRWGLLDQCETLARATHLTGSIVVIAAIGVAARIVWRESNGIRARQGFQ
jgi:hypothetical protein